MLQLFITGFIDIRILDIVDILLVALLLFEMYRLLRGTVAINIFLGIVAIFVAWKVVDVLEMELLSEILGAFISVGFIALIVIFQPEIRRFLLALGTPNFLKKKKGKFLFWSFNMKADIPLDVDTILLACQRMADTKEGALIVLTKRNDLRQIIESGEIIDGQLSAHLIENIFFKNSPLHDGAMIISHNKITAAGCILPVSNNPDLPPRLGLRHRAAIGITEQSDAIAIVVSEQSGKLSFCKEGERIAVQPAKLKVLLEEEFGDPIIQSELFEESAEE
ncbi:MAG: TIGR00159 family protein [Bacteroidetes bacterium]|nr:TIGR00159 family protein [Bacteroidota bacterium]